MEKEKLVTEEIERMAAMMRGQQLEVYHNPRPGDLNGWQSVHRVGAAPLQEGIGAAMMEEALHRIRMEAMTSRAGGEQRIQEALINDPDAANLLRNSIVRIAFEAYSAAPVVYPQITRYQRTPNVKEMYYLRDGAIGLASKVASGDEPIRASRSIEGMARIESFKWEKIVAILGDDMRFDRLGVLNEIPMQLGHAMRMTIENEVWNVIRDSSNYTRNSSTGDNDEGANAQSVVLNAAGLDTAFRVLFTMRDRTSGMPARIVPNTLLIGAKSRMAAQQLLMTDSWTRVGGSSSNELHGTGQGNQLRFINNIIVTPFFDNHEWALFSSSDNRLMLQEVESLTVKQQSMANDNSNWFLREEMLYKGMIYFGCDFADDRAWFLSTTTTAPTIA